MDRCHRHGAKQHHLTTEQQADLLAVLLENNKLFDGWVGIYPHEKVHIDIDPDAKPVHMQPYPMPHIHLAIFKNNWTTLYA